MNISKIAPTAKSGKMDARKMGAGKTFCRLVILAVCPLGLSGGHDMAHSDAIKAAMRKTRKRSPWKWGGTAKLKTHKINLAKPVQGQGEGSVIFAPDYDPCAPAFSESDWKS